jgi:hypothetical protein
MKHGREAAIAINTLPSMATGAARPAQASQRGCHLSLWAIIKMVKLATRMANGIGHMNKSANAERGPGPGSIQSAIGVTILGNTSSRV